MFKFLLETVLIDGMIFQAGARQDFDLEIFVGEDLVCAQICSGGQGYVG